MPRDAVHGSAVHKTNDKETMNEKEKKPTPKEFL